MDTQRKAREFLLRYNGPFTLSDVMIRSKKENIPYTVSVRVLDQLIDAGLIEYCEVTPGNYAYCGKVRLCEN